jgi:predicted transposase/invertase (TIGR01784 family)
MFQESIIRGEDYSKTKRTICIIITDFNIESLLNNNNYHNKYMALNCSKIDDCLTNKMEIHIIELTKMDSTNAIENNLKEWCTFLKYPERIGDSVMNENENIKAAKEELELINSDDLEKRRADEREKALMDHIWWKNSAIKEGKEIGIKEGREIGIKEGKKEGIKEGEKKGFINAIQMLYKLNMPFKQIVASIKDSFGYPEKEIVKEIHTLYPDFS